MASPVGSMLQLWLLLTLLIDLSSSQSMNPQNIETFYPVFVPDPPLSPPPIPDPPISTTPALSPAPETPAATPPPSGLGVGQAVAVTAASTLVFAVIFFFAVQRYCLYRRLKQKQAAAPNPYADPPMVFRRRFSRVGRNVVVDENGLDVVYWRKLEAEKRGFRKQSDVGQGEDDVGRNRGRSRKGEPVQEVPLLRQKSSTSYDFNRIPPEIQDKHQIFLAVAPPPATATSGIIELKAIGKLVSVAAPPLPLPPVRKSSALPPVLAPPPPPPTGSKPPPNGSKTPTAPPKGTVKPSAKKESESETEEVNGQPKLKPFYWEKVNADTEAWNKLDKGSFRFDGDLLVAMFGTVATNRSPPNSSNKPPISAPSSSSQIAILDPRKSQNIAIVVKSLGISRQTLVASLEEGHGLEIETIEKLTRIAPTKEEETKILSFAGDPARLADAESFLYHLLKPVPSAFNRLDLMLFRSLYATEIEQLRESLQTLESGCNELRTRGLFLKLLEAVLKAGNRMNVGTARGNAQAFNLTALRKLSDVKSTDGKTTLLHFVVEEVVRAEGKRGTLNRNRSLSRNNSLNSSDKSKDDREKQYTILGLPVVGGLSAEFTNVKKSAGIDHDAFAGTWSNLSARVSESQRLVAHCESDGIVVGGFVREMRTFLVNAEEELKVVGAEQRRVTELVKRTTEYYQAGASKDRRAVPLQLFVIVKDFLAMVDQVCIQIARNLQKKTSNSSSNVASAKRSSAKFPILPKHFMSDKSSTSSSESDSD